MEQSNNSSHREKETHNNDLSEKNTIEKKHLINKLNQINFNNGLVQVNLKHTKYNSIIACFASPQPCFSNQLECLWSKASSFGKRLKSYKFHNLIITDEHKTFLVNSDLTSISETGISLLLPESCMEFDSRKSKRHICNNISAQIVQNGALFYGYLNNFSSDTFHVTIKISPPQTSQWINEVTGINAVFFDKNETLYSGKCEVLKKISGEDSTIDLILETTGCQMPRYAPKNNRCKRYRLLPSPKIIFKHPFTKKMVEFKAFDFSESGFGVEENDHESVLLPGMIIPKLFLRLGNIIDITCKAQVVYRIKKPDNPNLQTSRNGLVILDMTPEDYLRYFALLNQVKNENIYITSYIDTDSLWNCLFETDHITPEIYDFIHSNKAEIKQTFNKINSSESRSINRHFIYQKNGALTGHISMLLLYKNSWLLHHVAFNKSSAADTEPALLDQAAHFAYNASRLGNLNVDYVLSYISEEKNTFLNNALNNCEKNLNNPKSCSIDQFAYLKYKKTENGQTFLPFGWELSKTTQDDLSELKSFYEDISGGLMLKALNLEYHIIDDNQIFSEFKKAGIKRDLFVFSLKKDNDLKTIIIADISEIGLNISNFTNCIKMIVLDPESVTTDIFYSTISIINKEYEQKETTVLVNPVIFAVNNSIPFEKQYNLWIIKAGCSDRLIDYIKDGPGNAEATY